MTTNRECFYGTDFQNNGACVQNYGTVDTRPGRLLAFPNVLQHRVSGFKLADPTKPGHRRFIALWLVDPHVRILSTANVPPQQRQWWADAAFGAPTDSRQRMAAVDKLSAEMVALLQEKGLHLPPPPPQSQSQQSQSTGNGDGREMRLPAELLDLVRDDLGDLPLMNLEEAKKHRLTLMAHRSTASDKVLGQLGATNYNFCEH